MLKISKSVANRYATNKMPIRKFVANWHATNKMPISKSVANQYATNKMLICKTVYRNALIFLDKGIPYFWGNGVFLLTILIQEHYFYIIEDAFFERFNDPNLRGNKSENRPHYYAFKEEETGLYWVIPSSTKVEKYQRILESREKKKQPTDIIHMTKHLHKESVLLIQDMFPVTENYLKRNYTVGGHALKIVDTSELAEISKKANKIRALIKNKVKFGPTQPKVLEIEAALLKDIEAESSKE